MIDYLVIKDTQLNRTVMEILRLMGPEAAPRLREILEEGTLGRSCTADLLTVLVEIEDEESSVTFHSFMEADDPELRAMAVRGLASGQHADLLDLFLRFTHDESPSVRKQCVLAFKDIEDPAAIKALISLLADEAFSVRFAAFEALQMKKTAAKPYLIEFLTDQKKHPVYAVDLTGDLLE